MARNEQDREDLLRQATALVQRAEVCCPHFDDSIVCGFRNDGSSSVFFGADPVYQFNTRSELRRGYIGGQIIKAECGKLITLQRRTKDCEIQLIRHPLNERETQEYLAQLAFNLSQLRSALTDDRFELIGQVPEDEDVVTRIISWLQSLPAEIEIAQTARLR